jgi:transposase-like protein
MFLIRGIVFSHEAVCDWEAKLTLPLAEGLRRRRCGKAGRSWYVDETWYSVSTERLISRAPPSRLGGSALPLPDASGFMESM